ncbi:phage head closure protein [Massilia soli]|uniref:Phage head closure protein n=1 Tax=Massilia soli TaxID=2792854 RepID=A0ABS7SRB2_9BURK|nr:phage head closure protein [Massilia soli]MBZ2208475.1 phage head closure protein [Massilia soli]
MNLNKRVWLDRPGDEVDAIGQPVEGWQPVGEFWANVRYLNGVETIKAGADTSIVKASIRLRYRTDVQASWRIRHGDVIFQVNAVMPDEQTMYHVDLACEVVR